MTFHTLDHQQNNLTEKLIEFVVQLQNQIVQLKEQNPQLQEYKYKRLLKLSGIVRLKKLSPKPDIKPNTMPSDDNSGNNPDHHTSSDSEGVDSSGNSEDDSPEDGSPKKDDNPGNEKSDIGKPNVNTRHTRKSPPKPPIDDEVFITVPAEQLPTGSRRNGHVPFDIQELVMRAIGIRYMLEQWITPDGVQLKVFLH